MCECRPYAFALVHVRVGGALKMQASHISKRKAWLFWLFIEIHVCHFQRPLVKRTATPCCDVLAVSDVVNNQPKWDFTCLYTRGVCQRDLGVCVV
jgi:hypothetical protein